jgi:glycosyltransferase involved in cell wall biosynthesis
MDVTTWLAAALAGLGTLYWTLFAILGALGRRSTPQVAELPLISPERWPSLSVVVATRDEGQRLVSALSSMRRSDYPGLEIIVVDDRSGDDTAAVLAELARLDPRVVPVRVDELPVRWLGKVHALARGLERAHGEWVLFTDADVHLAPDALRRVIGHCERNGFDHFGVLPEVLPAGLVVDAAVWSFMRMVVAIGAHRRAVEDPKSRASVGVGAFNLFRRRALTASPGLERLRMEVLDDAALGQLLKRAGARSSLAFGVGQVRVQIYDSLRDLLRATDRAGIAALGRFRVGRLIAMALLLGLVELAPLLGPCLAPAPWILVLGGLGMVMAMVATYGTSRALGPGSWHALLVPLGSMVMTFAYLRSAWVTVARGGMVWRETVYRLDELEAGRAFEL